ncbi:MAG: excinuclease ABC subunit UvrC [Coriobacteriales bacterium]|jgi:excinuclease ABC subunit C
MRNEASHETNSYHQVPFSDRKNFEEEEDLSAFDEYAHRPFEHSADERLRAEASWFHSDKSDPDIREQLKSVPDEPGCYLWKNAKGEILYVGKAVDLRSRMTQYVTGQDERAKIPLMMEQVASFDYIVVNNETESLVLEKNLIQQYHPPFNVDYRDNKSYPYIAITEGEVYPGIKYTREKHKKGTRYFGPYTDARAARETIDTVRRIVPICSCSCAEWRRLCRKLANGTWPKPDDKACFEYHIGKGAGPCCAAITPEEYRGYVERVERFLSGQRSEFENELAAEMNRAAADLDFEHAARVRDRLEAIKALQEKQKAILSRPLNMDVIGFFREETIAAAHVFVVREGRVIVSNDFILDKGLNIPNADLVGQFLSKYYDSTEEIPHEVVIAEELPEEVVSPFENWLTLRLASPHGAKVHVTVPQRGERFDLLKMAEVNAKHALMRHKVRTRYDEERTDLALLQLESALALPEPPMRIECFDVSTIHGNYSVASMVVFTAGKPDKSQYRRFKIRKSYGEANDFAMMSEVLRRRYSPETRADEKFGSMPDLLILDGGKPQLTAALNELGELGVDIPVAGLAKKDEELFVPWEDSGPIVLPSGSPSLYLVKHVRDESHRFAITFHRELRDKGMVASILDDVPGLGPKRKKLLLKTFGSVKKMRQASLEEIKAVPGIPDQVAEDLYAVILDANA